MTHRMLIGIPHPGELIYTGTLGETGPIKPGDVVEIDIEGIGVYRNPVKCEGG